MIKSKPNTWLNESITDKERQELSKLRMQGVYMAIVFRATADIFSKP